MPGCLLRCLALLFGFLSVFITSQGELFTVSEAAETVPRLYAGDVLEESGSGESIIER